LNQAYDQYGIIRDAWLQRREYLVYDGAPPEPTLEDDVGMEEEDVAADEPSDTEAATPSEPVSP
jgi:phospholipid-binding lipoprotein MlaA